MNSGKFAAFSMIVGLVAIASPAAAGLCQNTSPTWGSPHWSYTMSCINSSWGYGKGTTNYGAKSLLAKKTSDAAQWVAAAAITSDGSVHPTCQVIDTTNDSTGAGAGPATGCGAGVKFIVQIQYW